ncbi:ribonuclease H2, subunit B [Xylariales sp. AK1849]|nr:ribonuclease H2, subunit B [Xylariales sp. AK1849]
MARTRAKGGASTTSKSASKSQTAASSESRYTLEPASSNPPKIFILPKLASKEARVVSLLNPRYNKPTRYLVCPEAGAIYDFTRVAAPKSTPRSWLAEYPRPGPNAVVEEENIEKTEEEAAKDKDEEFGAYISKGADLYIATPIDPLFLVLPALAGQQSSTNLSSKPDSKRLFLSFDDHFDTIPKSSSPHLSEIVRWEKVRNALESRMAAVCDTVDAGDENMYRLSEEKLLARLLSKAQKMSEGQLPRSMEDKFVIKALEAPVLSVKRETTTTTIAASEIEPAASESGALTPKVEASESQSSVSSTETTATSVSEASTAATSIAADEEIISTELQASIVASPEVTHLQRLRVAFSFILSSYIAPVQASVLKALLSSSSTQDHKVDFAPLDEYLAQVAKLRQDAVASRSMADYSRKRVLDDEEVMERAEKKQRKEEEEKRKKAGESRGVRDLKKVNTTGMRKMSDFFKKK